MDVETLHKISPSTSVAKFSSHATPKRTLTPQRMITDISEEGKEKGTPLRKNPFDVKAESLYLPSCSPSVFATFQRNKVDDGTFRWSIEHLSVLYPADIDETSVPETWVDADHEMKAQKAIDTFFSQNSIVPSPWSSSPKEGKSDIKLRRRARVNSLFTDVQNCDATTQTTLSIPPNIDLTKILGNFFTFDENEESSSLRENSRDEIDLLSTSSLRRKLFANDEDCISPCREENYLYSAKRRNTPAVRKESVQSTPSSDLLSSSPITPPNCSDACNIFASPTLSPIIAAPARSMKLQSFNEQDAMESAYQSPEKLNHISSVNAPESIMSFCAESQDTIPFPSSYMSERQDTGYASRSISSSQNMTSSEAHYGLVSRITPVTELMEECELSSNSMSCDMSYKNDSRTGEELRLFECSKLAHPHSCNFKTYPWIPACCSTPAPDSHL